MKNIKGSGPYLILIHRNPPHLPDLISFRHPLLKRLLLKRSILKNLFMVPPLKIYCLDYKVIRLLYPAIKRFSIDVDTIKPLESKEPKINVIEQPRKAQNNTQIIQEIATEFGVEVEQDTGIMIGSSKNSKS